MMQHLRSYETTSSLCQSWLHAYSQLVAAEYSDNQFLSLGFGIARQFVIEGTDLGEFTSYFQKIQYEYPLRS